MGGHRGKSWFVSKAEDTARITDGFVSVFTPDQVLATRQTWGSRSEEGEPQYREEQE